MVKKQKKRGGMRGGGNTRPPVKSNRYFYPEQNNFFSKGSGPGKHYDVAAPPWHREGLGTGPVAGSTSWDDRDRPERMNSTFRGTSGMEDLREVPWNQKIPAGPSNWNDRSEGGFCNPQNNVDRNQSNYDGTNLPQQSVPDRMVPVSLDQSREASKWDSYDNRLVDRPPEGPLNQDRSRDGPYSRSSTWDRQRESMTYESSSLNRGPDFKGVGIDYPPWSDDPSYRGEATGNDRFIKEDSGGLMNRPIAKDPWKDRQSGVGTDHPPDGPRNRPDEYRGDNLSATMSDREAMLLREREDRLRREREEMLRREREEMIMREREEMVIREREEMILREEKLIREIESMRNSGPSSLMDRQGWNERKRPRAPDNKNIWNRLEPDRYKKFKLEMPDKFGHPLEVIQRPPPPSKFDDLRRKLSRGPNPKSVYPLHIISRKQFKRFTQVEIPIIEEAICRKLYSIAGSENAESQPQLRFNRLRLVGSAIEVKCMNRETAMWLLNTQLTTKPNIKLRVVYPEDINVQAIISFSTKINTGPLLFRDLLKHQNPGLEVFSWKSGEIRKLRKRQGLFQYLFSVDGHTLRYLEYNNWYLFLGDERIRVRKYQCTHNNLDFIMI